MTPSGLRREALAILVMTDPGAKAEAAKQLHAQAVGLVSTLSAQEVAQITDACVVPTMAQTLALPGRPALPVLVSAKEVPTRSPFTTEGRAALLHAICHIEFNAINLALDAVWRFQGMPMAFYLDWLRVASEEALHFNLLREHLKSLGFDYGDFQAHDGLWSMCQRTADDILARMALVPRTLEARGLDATPPIQAKLLKAGDTKAVSILDLILQDEVGHVAVGNRWFHALCEQRGIDPVPTYGALIQRYDAPRLRPPYNVEARRAAGFTDMEMRYLLGEMG
jgi:uncharacterized ferritin-like protein (DUF455 family)